MSQKKVPNEVIAAAKTLRHWVTSDMQRALREPDTGYQFHHPAELLDELRFFLDVYDLQAPPSQPPCDNEHVAPGCEPFPEPTP